MGHQDEGVLGRDQMNLDVHPVREIPVLCHDVCVQASQHVHFPAPGCQLSSDFQPADVVALGVVKVMRRVPIIKSWRQLTLFGISTVAEGRFYVGPVGVGIFAGGDQGVVETDVHLRK